MRLRSLITAVAVVAFVAATALAEPLNCSLDEYMARPGLAAEVANDVLTLTWDGDEGQELRLRLANVGGTPTIRELAIRRSGGDWQTVASDASVEFRVAAGIRRITQQQLSPESIEALGAEVTPAVEAAREKRTRRGNVQDANPSWIQPAVDEGGLTKEILDREKWKAFWDAPLNIPGDQVAHGGSQPPVDGITIDGKVYQPPLPRSPDEATRAKASFQVQSCTVKTTGSRLEVTFPGVEMGVFNSGRLELTVYRRTNLIRAALVAKTDEPSVAYKYDAGLAGLQLAPGSRMVWRDISNLWQDYDLSSATTHEDLVPVQAANRLMVAEGPGGSLAAFPPPHRFFWVREIEYNLGYNWYRKDESDRFSFGIRQSEREALPYQHGRGAEDTSQNFALYNARPGTWQVMPVFFHVSPAEGQPAFEEALAYTRGDHYKPLPGYQVMAQHFHTSPVRRAMAAGGLNVRLHDFDAMKAAGVKIFGPVGGGSRGGFGEGAEGRLKSQAAYYELARLHSDNSFLIMPNQEVFNGVLGGHMDFLISKPVFWIEERAEGEPFVEDHPEYGHVYRLGTAEDMMEMARREGILMYMPHPRSKGSTGFPDGVQDTKHFRDDHYRGGGFRWGMGIDLSETRLCEYRCLDLLDDMNNWVADLPVRPKYLQAITETYQRGPGDDIYGNNPVSYVKIDKVPKVDDMSSITDAMMEGNYFVTSGEVLIPYYQVTGSGNDRTIAAELEWTFPLDFVEVVWGDGQTTDRQIISAADLPAFGQHRYEIPFDATGKKWVRFAAWDVAGNGAFVQPIKLNQEAATDSDNF